MKKRIVVLLFCMLLFATLFLPAAAIGGDEQNPEITDEQNDTYGIPGLPIPKRSLNSIDIISAWFYENQNEPDFLFISVKVVDLNYLPFLRSTYSVTWSHDEVRYMARLSTQLSGAYFFATVRVQNTYRFHLINANFDRENNIVTFRIPKNVIGDPSVGNVLTQTRAWNTLKILGFDNDLDLVKDTAPSDTLTGKNYVIQY